MSVITLDDARKSRQPKLVPRSDRPAKSRAKEFDVERVRSDLRELEGMGLRSFSQEFKKLLSLVDADADYVSAKADAALKRAQMASVIRALSVADQSVEKMGSRGAYAFVALHGLARELAHDLRNADGGEELVSKVVEQVVRPILQELASKVIAQVIAASRDIYADVGGKSAEKVRGRMRRLQRDAASAITDADASARERASNLLTTK